MNLPTTKSPVLEENPKFLILFGKPKCGKTTITAALEDALHIDMENGSDYVEAMKVKANSMEELQEIKKALQDKFTSNGNKPVYTYGVLDTATALEDMILPLAKKLYKDTPMGKSFSGNDVKKLPNGAGYLYVREAFHRVINGFIPYFKYLILLGHTKEKMINKMGKELSENALDLSGKLERIVSAKADALGYVYRSKNKTLINFNGGDDAVVEARPEHIRGKEIVIAESDDAGKMTFYWDKIYKPITTK